MSADGSSSAPPGEAPAAVTAAQPATAETAQPAFDQADQAAQAEAPKPIDPTILLIQNRLQRSIAEPNTGEDTSRDTLEALAADPQEMEREDAVQVMVERENWHQHTFGERAGKDDPEVGKAKRQELIDRYRSEGASRKATEQRIEEYAQKVGADRSAGLEAIPDGEAFFTAEGSKDRILAQAEPLIQAYFNSDQGSFSTEGELDQAKIVRTQTEQYVALVRQAIEEGSIPDDITSREVYQLVADNIAALGLQDRAATEVLLGDHGVRHLVDHNINVAADLAAQLKAKGYPMTAKDTLLLHQIMLYHDIGYAMDPVRMAIRQDGPKGQDADHALLAAQFVREHMVDTSSPWNKIFNTQDFETMHRAISFHDSADTGVKQVDFSRLEGPDDIEGKRRIIESIVRTADNTHAFEDKLPALIYAVPESLKYMRLLKTAGEVGDKAAEADIKARFAQVLESSTGISSGDKEAFLMALNKLTPSGYKFTVGRIAGRKPEFSLEDQADGGVKVVIKATESRAHQSVVEAFGMDGYGQMRKFVKDVLGENFSEEDFQSGTITSKDLEIQIRKRGQARRESSTYEKSVMKALRSDPKFALFVRSEKDLNILERDINTTLAAQADLTDEKFAARAQLILGKGIDGMTDRASITAVLEAQKTGIAGKKAELLSHYLDQLK